MESLNLFQNMSYTTYQEMVRTVGVQCVRTSLISLTRNVTHIKCLLTIQDNHSNESDYRQEDLVAIVKKFKSERELLRSNFRRGTSQLLQNKEKQKNRKKIAKLDDKINATIATIKSANSVARKFGLEETTSIPSPTSIDIEDPEFCSLEHLFDTKDLVSKCDRYAEEVKELVPNESNAYRLNTQYLVVSLASGIKKIETDIKDESQKIRIFELFEFKSLLQIYQHQQLCWCETMNDFMDSRDIERRGMPLLTW